MGERRRGKEKGGNEANDARPFSLVNKATSLQGPKDALRQNQNATTFPRLNTAVQLNQRDLTKIECRQQQKAVRYSFTYDMVPYNGGFIRSQRWSISIMHNGRKIVWVESTMVESSTGLCQVRDWEAQQRTTAILATKHSNL